MSEILTQVTETLELLDPAKEVAREIDFHKGRFGKVGLVAAPLILTGSAHIRDLRVRVTGYSGIFVDMCRRLQDDVIARMEQE